jgi:predicted N-acetyltransferase YhbS
MKADYDDATIRRAIYDLYDTSFGRLSERIAISDGLGAVWHEVSTAVVALEDERPVSHVGVIEIPMVVNGQSRVVAGIHAVCTHPDHRGRGLSSALIREALQHADQRTDTAILATSITGFYTTFGFRLVPENRFVIGWTGAHDPEAPPPRKLSADDPADVRILFDLLERRTHVSDIIAAVDPGWLFVIDEVLHSRGFERLYLFADLDAVVAFEISGRTLVLLDIVAPEPVPLDRIIPRIGTDFDTIETLFTPDRTWDGPVSLAPGDPDDCLMARGNLAVAAPCALSQLARC